MATPNPAINLFSPVMQQIRDEFEESVFPDGGFEQLEREIRREYLHNACRPYICALIGDVLSGRWGLGSTQQEIADELGMDRSRVSDALRKGELTLESYLALKFYDMRPKDWEPEGALDAANRAGFIGVANLLARRSPQRQRLVEQVDEFHHELLCEEFCKYLTWTEARFTGNASVAVLLVNTVGNNPQGDIVPNYHLEDARRRTGLLIERLISDQRFAFEYLCRLQDDWEDVYIATETVTETLVWTK